MNGNPDGERREQDGMEQTQDGVAARVRVLSRDGCHLCEEAERIVDRICAEVGTGWERVDIDLDPDLCGRYTDQVPVTFIDGEQHDFWRVDPDRLRAALTA